MIGRSTIVGNDRIDAAGDALPIRAASGLLMAVAKIRRVTKSNGLAKRSRRRGRFHHHDTAAHVVGLEFASDGAPRAKVPKAACPARRPLQLPGEGARSRDVAVAGTSHHAVGSITSFETPLFRATTKKPL